MGLEQRKADKIEWAAFYSDCEHEVMEVQSGHRVTLTYNLYVRERLGAIARAKQITPEPKSYPLFVRAKEALAQPEFMKNGKSLITHCHSSLLTICVP